MTLQTLSKEFNDYFENIIVHSFLPMVKSDLISVIWDVDGNLKIATDKYAQLLGFDDWTQIKNRNVKNPDPSQFPILKGVDQEYIKYAIDIFQQITLVRQTVIEIKHPVSVIIIHPFSKVFDAPMMVYQMPIFYQDGSLIGVQMILSRFNLFGINEYLGGRAQKEHNATLSVIKDASDLPIALSNRQHEIVFLLSIGFSQRELADILGISRGSVAKTISEAICPKFAIYDIDTNLLISKARQMNLHKFIPRSLCKPWIIKC